MFQWRAISCFLWKQSLLCFHLLIMELLLAKTCLDKILRVKKHFRHGLQLVWMYHLWKNVHYRTFIKYALCQFMFNYPVVKQQPPNQRGFIQVFIFIFCLCLPVFGLSAFRRQISSICWFRLLQSCDNLTSTGNFRAIRALQLRARSISIKHSRRT
jgi:hypothetical protein